jgi:hypothetical protein
MTNFQFLIEYKLSIEKIINTAQHQYYYNFFFFQRNKYCFRWAKLFCVCPLQFLYFLYILELLQLSAHGITCRFGYLHRSRPASSLYFQLTNDVHMHLCCEVVLKKYVLRSTWFHKRSVLRSTWFHKRSHTIISITNIRNLYTT